MTQSEGLSKQLHGDVNLSLLVGVHSTHINRFLVLLKCQSAQMQKALVLIMPPDKFKNPTEWPNLRTWIYLDFGAKLLDVQIN